MSRLNADKTVSESINTRTLGPEGTCSVPAGSKAEQFANCKSGNGYVNVENREKLT